MFRRITARVVLATRLLRAEGIRSLIARWRDRRLDEVRFRRFERVDSESAGARAPTLWVLPFPLQRRRGGAAIQLLVRLEELARSRPVALLQRLPSGWRCEIWGAGVERPLAREWPHTTDGELSLVLSAVRWSGASRLHFESLVDVPLALPLAAAGNGTPFGFSAHDFALFCPRPHLIEEPTGRFCGFSTDAERCARCLAAEPSPAPRSARGELDGVEIVGPGYQEARRQVASQLVAAADRIEFPSDYMRRTHLRLFPGVERRNTLIVRPQRLRGEEPEARSVLRPPRRIAFAGAVHRHKGAAEFEAVVRILTRTEGERFEWHIFGGGDPKILARLRRLKCVRVHGYFRAGSLPRHLVANRIDLVLLLSTWPEAHCLVLDECATARVPVVAFDLGAQGERVRIENLGSLVDPLDGASGVAALLDASR